MNILRIAAFCNNGFGGNPAGVVFNEEMPAPAKMLAIAKQVGYSETAFLAPHPNSPGQGDTTSQLGWRVRYFAPECEVPFCGHATIAIGAALHDRYGQCNYTLYLNDSVTAQANSSKGDLASESPGVTISVSTQKTASGFDVSFQSPTTWSKEADPHYVDKVLRSFGLSHDKLDPAFPVRLAFGGARHLIIVFKERNTLTQMAYEFGLTRSLMLQEELATIALLWKESDDLFHSRNAFAAGGVYEDPATGAAAAAFGGYLRDINWQGNNTFAILQGQDMGVDCRLLVDIGPNLGQKVVLTGQTRIITHSD